MINSTSTTASTPIPRDRIQGIVLHGYGGHHEASFVLLRVRPDRARDAKRFLSGLELTSAAAATASGDAAARRALPPFVNVAFTHDGLRALALDGALLDDFPRDFVEGPTNPTRARLLGDLGPSGPEHWTWGSGDHVVHVVLLVYAYEAAALRATCGELVAGAEGAGLDVVAHLGTIRLPRRQEHFGFRDGIGQPSLAGNPPESGRPPPPSANVIADGEVLLGHENAFGETAYAPGALRGDAFAMHGSYLVFRQLRQDVAAFWRFCRSGVENEDEAIRLASQMVGRWPSGAPLVKYPPTAHARDPFEGSSPDDNHFEYADVDPRGLACPFGAHIRRANPRDAGVAATADRARRVVARHRIIRRGRAYGDPLCPDAEPRSYLRALSERGEGSAIDGSPHRGLHFLCFNANIEQQFEFVQRQWCDNPKFAGAVNGVDPLLGNPRTIGHEPPTFSIQGETTTRRVELVARFVQVEGSAYFFMPSIDGVRSLAQR